MITLMENLSLLGLLLGGSWASGVNLYLTIAGLGIAHRMGWFILPGTLDSLSSPIVIAIAIILYLIEFFADKIPYIDSLWDSFHTFIRPAGGVMLGYMAMNGASEPVQFAVGLVTGVISLDSHLTKATSRAAINTSPEPVSNITASVTEDVGVLGALYLIIQNPVTISVLVVVFIVFSFWFLRKMFKYMKKIFKPKKASSSQ